MAAAEGQKVMSWLDPQVDRAKPFD
jgi:hypothetical protein